MRWDRYLLQVGEPLGDLGQLCHQLRARTNRPGLGRCPGPQLRAPRPSSPVLRSLLRGHLGDRAADMHLPAQRVPGESHRGIGRRRQVGPFSGVVVGVERDPDGVDALAQHRTGHRSAGLDGREHHGVRLGDAGLFGVVDPVVQQRKPAIGQPVHIEVAAAVLLHRPVLDPHRGEAVDGAFSINHGITVRRGVGVGEFRS